MITQSHWVNYWIAGAAGRGHGGLYKTIYGLHEARGEADSRFARGWRGSGVCFQEACFLLAWPRPAAEPVSEDIAQDFPRFWRHRNFPTVFLCKPAPKITISLETKLRSALECCNRACAKLWWSFSSLKSHRVAGLAGSEFQFGFTLTKETRWFSLGKDVLVRSQSLPVQERCAVFLWAHRVHSNWFPSGYLRTARLARPFPKIDLNHAVFQWSLWL